MRIIRVALFTLTACLGAARAEAGIYTTSPVLDPAEQTSGPMMMLPQFNQAYGKYLRAANPQMPEHKDYLARIKKLEEKENGPLGLTTDERIDLSAYYLRVQQPEKAVQALIPVAGAGQRNFMVLANLATAHHLSGRLQRAVDYTDMAMKEWPSSWPGWTQNQLSWFYQVERYYLTLLRSRLLEERFLAGKPAEILDELFPGVRFVGLSGHYEAGRIDPLQYARLPADHLAVVGQLLLWLPLDSRLAWLFGELLNANSNIADAKTVLDTLVYTRGYSPPALKEHLQILKEAVPVLVVWNEKMAPKYELYRLLWAVSPRGGTAPGAWAIGNEVGYATSLRMQRMQTEMKPTQPDETPVPPARDAKTAWMPDLRHIIVSFLAGVALTLLASMQLREIRRRRTADAAKS